MIDYYNIDLECPITWELIATGKTKGCFQIESPLGQTWCKKIKPRNIEELADLISLIRPGCLNSMAEDGKSMTAHYTLRKNGEEEATPIHPALEHLLRSTQQIIVYQEQTIKIAVEIAGFNPVQADTLRKAMGKKRADIMAKVRSEFIVGCINTGKVNEQEANMIFDIIEKSNRYSFNKSHAVSYAYVAYWSAYLKAHAMKKFYCAWLQMADEKIKPLKEIQELVDDARFFKMSVFPPSLQLADFTIIPEKNAIQFGVGNIKGIGKQTIDKITVGIHHTENELKKKIPDWTWEDFLFFFTKYLTSSACESIISVGGTKPYCHRRRMLYEYNIWKNLDEKEQDFIIKNKGTLLEGLKAISLYDSEQIIKKEALKKQKVKVKDMGVTTLSSTRRSKVDNYIKVLENPPYLLEDDIGWILKQERELLGVGLSYTKIDERSNHLSNTTCREMIEGRTDPFVIGVEVTSVKEFAIKKGQNAGRKMCYLKVTDGTGILDNICLFCDAWEKYGNIIYEGATLVLKGKGNDRGFVVDEVKVL